MKNIISLIVTIIISFPMMSQDSDSKSFKTFGNYQVGTNHVWFKGKLLDGIDIKTFKVLDRPVFYSMPEGDYTDYAIDKNSVFYQGNRMLKVDLKTFKISIDYSRPLAYAKDNTHIYYAGKIVNRKELKKTNHPDANLIFIKNIPKSNEILRVEFSKFLNSYTTLDESNFLNALDNKPKSLDPKDEIISEWNYAPWYSITFYTDKGKYDIDLFLGSLGIMTLPSGQKGAFMFDFEKNKKPSDNKKVNTNKNKKR